MNDIANNTNLNHTRNCILKLIKKTKKRTSSTRQLYDQPKEKYEKKIEITQNRWQEQEQFFSKTTYSY